MPAEDVFLGLIWIHFAIAILPAFFAPFYYLREWRRRKAAQGREAQVAEEQKRAA